MDFKKFEKVLIGMQCCKPPWITCHSNNGGCPYYKKLRKYSCRYGLINDTRETIVELLSEVLENKNAGLPTVHYANLMAKMILDSNGLRGGYGGVALCINCKERDSDKYINSDGVEVSACDICVNNEQAVKVND